MNPQPAVRAPNEVRVIFLHLEVVDRDRLLALLPLNLRDSERRSGASDNCVPERKPSGDDEPDALHHEGMFAGGSNRLDYLTGEGERDDSGI